MGYVVFWSFMITFVMGIIIAVLVGIYEGRKERKARAQEDKGV
ncbi:MAG: hypothetical protein U0451_01305 [Candidatus Saccharimonadales bacterium]